MATEITVPALGESVTEGSIGEWLKQPGDAVAADEPICSLETDKVAIDVPSPVAGVMSEHRAAVGDTVEVGAVIAIIEEGATGAATAGEEPARAQQKRAEGKEERASQTREVGCRRLPPPRKHSPPPCAVPCWNTGSIPPRSREPARMAA